MGWVTYLLKEVPLSAVMKERLLHEEKLHEETKAKNVDLQRQVDELTKEVTRLRSELAALKLMEEYQERGGVLRKKDIRGGFSEGPRCPKCKTMMHRIRSKTMCSQCGVMVG